MSDLNHECKLCEHVSVNLYADYEGRGVCSLRSRNLEFKYKKYLLTINVVSVSLSFLTTLNSKSFRLGKN